MKKLTKKLMLSILTVALTFIALGTSTFAWFSMNQSVNVSGMEVHTVVNDNLLIAPCAVDATSKVADNTFKYGYVNHVEALLEPASSINGANFYYTSTKNVIANGNANADAYTAYNPASTTAFNDNYSTTGAVAYIDYSFQLKADNSKDSTQYINLTSLTLKYGAATDTQKAFRVAIFVDDMGVDGSTAASATQTSSNLKTILPIQNAAYFDPTTAVKDEDELAAVLSYQTPCNIGSVGTGADATHFYKVVVRLWLEGEDTTCNNTTFASLTDTWALDLVFTLENATGGVTYITASAASRVDLSTATITSDTKVVDGVTYKALSVNGYYVANTVSDLTASNIVVFYIDANNVVTDVTNQVILP